MTIEILYSEVCNLFGDPQNAEYLKASCPDALCIETEYDKRPYFADHDVDFLYMGAMTEDRQRKVLEKLRPYKARLAELCDRGTVMLFTGNAGDIFCREINYVTENITAEGLGFFDMTVRTDWFKRVNGKIIGEADGQIITGFRSQFAEYTGDNSACCFVKAERGAGASASNKCEGLRKNNLICTQIIGPILPLNPDFCTYLIRLAGGSGSAAFYEYFKEAYDKRVKEFREPSFKI